MSTTMTSAQILLVWTLFSFLFVWLVVCILLALRPASRKAEEISEAAASDYSQRRTPTPSRVSALSTSPASGSLPQEATNDVGTIRVG